MPTPQFKVFLADRLCCTVTLGQVQKSSDLGAIKIEIQNAIAFELFKSLFLSSRFRIVGAPEQGTNNWGMCDWDDLKSIFDQFPSPWKYQEVDAPRSEIVVWNDRLDQSIGTIE